MKFLEKRRNKKAAVLIQGAISAIDQYGWVQNFSGNIYTGFCASGALGFARRELGYSNDVSATATNALNNRAKWNSYIAFNDDYRTNEEDIKAFMLETAASLYEMDVKKNA